LVTCPPVEGDHLVSLQPYTVDGPIGSGYGLPDALGNLVEVLPVSDTLTINCVAVLPTPTPAPTPASVGGVSFAPPSDGADSAFDTTAATALVTGAVALTATAWYARRRFSRTAA
jgi:hypothetical protein